MFSIFDKVLKASGRYVNIPDASCRIYPARINKRWLGITASEGASREVWLNNLEILMIISNYESSFEMD